MSQIRPPCADSQQTRPPTFRDQHWAVKAVWVAIALVTAYVAALLVAGSIGILFRYLFKAVGLTTPPPHSPPPSPQDPSSDEMRFLAVFVPNVVLAPLLIYAYHRAMDWFERKH